MKPKQTILITGGAGFIGSHLSERFWKQGHRIICLDNLQSSGSTRNIRHLIGKPRFRFIKRDILQPLPFSERVDWIFNFACSGSYISYQFDPIHTIRTNTEGVILLLERARRDTSGFLQASTSEVYGNPTKSPQRENYNGNVNPLGPRACYDEGKRAAETITMDFRREYGVDTRIIRIFNTYGPRMDPDDGRVVSNFVTSALAGRDLVIYGDGKQTRSFQYVGDLLKGIDRVLAKKDFPGPVNMGNPNEISINELARLVTTLTRSESRIMYDRPATDDPRRRKPDISLARRKLGWQPRVNLKTGLIKTIAYFKALQKEDIPASAKSLRLKRPK